MLCTWTFWHFHFVHNQLFHESMFTLISLPMIISYQFAIVKFSPYVKFVRTYYVFIPLIARFEMANIEIWLKI